MKDKYELQIYQHDLCSVKMPITDYYFNENGELVVTWDMLGIEQVDHYNLLNCDQLRIFNLKSGVVEFSYGNIKEVKMTSKRCERCIYHKRQEALR